MKFQKAKLKVSYANKKIQALKEVWRPAKGAHSSASSNASALPHKPPPSIKLSSVPKTKQTKLKTKKQPKPKHKQTKNRAELEPELHFILCETFLVK